MDRPHNPDSTVVEIDKKVSFGYASGSIIEITKKETEPDAMAGASVSAVPYAIWGKDNDRPQQIIDQNMQETTSAGALDFKIKAHFGRGLYFYKESISGAGKEIKTPMMIRELPAEMQEFYYNNDIQHFQHNLVANYEWFTFFPVQYICNASFNKIKWIKAHRTKDVRIGKRNVRTGEVPNYYLSAIWPKPKSEEYATVPAFDRHNPFEVANGIYKHECPSVDKDYYPTAYWQSNLHWMRVAMKIPKWIGANIDNSVNIKYHVEIPEQYFIDLYPEKNFDSKALCLAARMKAEVDIKQEIDKCLAGAENAQKIFYTKFAVDPVTNQVRPGWKITVIENKIMDQAWLNADATAAARISSAHSVNPSLTSLVTGSNLNVGSGSDTREKFNVHMQLHTVLPRQKTLEWYDIVQRANRWPEDIKLGYRDLILDTIDNTPSGTLVEHKPNPTSITP
jgi:hypothetical protein